MFRKLTVALMALAMAAGLAGAVAGEASAYPDRDWRPGQNHGWNQATNRVDVLVWGKKYNNWDDDRWGNDRWGNGRRGNDRWGNGPRWSSTPRVYVTESRTGRYVATAQLVDVDRSGSRIAYRYQLRNLPWNTYLMVRVTGSGTYSGTPNLYINRRSAGTVTLAKTFSER
ncbi:MAG: hypothetical protein KC435_10625 [Thermomicrobiales bacterium]|nr:hypothetical protein [Thermomicrobiales bacterium]